MSMIEAAKKFERRQEGILPLSVWQAARFLSERSRQQVLRQGGLQQKTKKLSLMADGLFYNDMREPAISADIAAVTLAATAKALYPASNFPTLGGQYWARPGKAMRIRLFGRMTTGATPGNGSFNVYYGNGADANGTLLMTGTPVALVANGTNLSWMVEIDVHCRTMGSAGTLFCTGWALFNVGLLLSTLAPMLLPASAPAVSGAVDLTAANIISIQFLRSGSTAETMQVHNMQVIALN